MIQYYRFPTFAVVAMSGVLGLLSASLAQTSHAGQYMYQPGTLATTGNTTLSRHFLSVTHNPAACSQVLRRGDRFRMSYLGNLGFAVELGQVDNFENEINDLVDTLDANVTSLDAARELETRFNNVLDEMERSGYLKLTGDVAVPAFPMAFRLGSGGGNLCLELNATAQVRGSVLSANGVQYDEVSNTLSTEASLYLKSAVQTHFGVTYSRSVLQREHGFMKGSLVFGTKIKAYRLSLSKQVIPFESFQNNDLGDIISDEFDQNQITSSTFGLDLGALWDGGRYQVGLTVANFVEPYFDYGTIGENCEALRGSSRFDSCQIAANFVARGELNGHEVHTMHTVPTIDASYAIFSNLFVAGSADLAEYNDAVGDDLRLVSVATSFMPSTRWIPGLRIGYRKNMAGERLSEATFGTTLFGLVNFDFLYGLDKIEVDGESYPRTIAVNFGLEQKF